ncbi:MAG: helix-turn-helix transcriptional regulator [Alphaproteobacteria bacterium]|nr:helix-turn-helix transcriptional regulator [Alphaproteobacteria bacterium]
MSEKKENHTWVRTLQRLMEEQGLNPRSLSLRAGLNATAVRDMIEGRSKFPRYDTVQALADVLGVTPAFLMGGQTPDAEAKNAAFGKDVELLTEIIARLQETASEMGRELTPREFAAMSASIYKQMQEEPESGRKNRLSGLKPQISNLLEYEVLRHKRGK